MLSEMVVEFQKLQLAEVKEAESIEASTDYPGGIDPSLKKKKKMAIG